MKKLLVLLMFSFSSIGGLMFLQQGEAGQKELGNREISTMSIEDANNICDCRQL
ncbi:Electron transport complex protein rnfG [Moritella viscosa]|uniref:Electron transport complex protein rnfG n=1 Tax=Moritella viscosa TaxID=80854 RepID=A0A1L0B1Z7_9GAMM|nr:hypothetical protein [Moritella viscosa]SGY90322.1 Electron transport complex protein rnfG [Moritella viscosa]SHO01136.1 Electron transport complex protein rnfG [Moritella viscosa]SHO01425.1 Electron transport complex protein rnfG [Moritella viscosa]SHO02068.1 Electron transport complex protein rnfG [Moritella viscosa]SHO03034.1 Electron transport complex protein rnfG [Moritella viscosa]